MDQGDEERFISRSCTRATFRDPVTTALSSPDNAAKRLCFGLRIKRNSENRGLSLAILAEVNATLVERLCSIGRRDYFYYAGTHTFVSIFSLEIVLGRCKRKFLYVASETFRSFFLVFYADKVLCLCTNIVTICPRHL